MADKFLKKKHSAGPERKFLLDSKIFIKNCKIKIYGPDWSRLRTRRLSCKPRCSVASLNPEKTINAKNNFATARNASAFACAA